MYVRFGAPPGMHVTFYQGKTLPRKFAAPVVVGLRPGYAYRVKLTDLPEHPGLALFPTLEVYGTLQLPPQLRGPTYPAPFPLAEIDIERVAASSMLTKVIYLEDPEKASPTATRLEEAPLESDLPAGSDPWVEARALGRPLVLLRLGGRFDSERGHRCCNGFGSRYGFCRWLGRWRRVGRRNCRGLLDRFVLVDQHFVGE